MSEDNRLFKPRNSQLNWQEISDRAEEIKAERKQEFSDSLALEREKQEKSNGFMNNLLSKMGDKIKEDKEAKIQKEIDEAKKISAIEIENRVRKENGMPTIEQEKINNSYKNWTSEN
jgi:hypothetical protein